MLSTPPNVFFLMLLCKQYSRNVLCYHSIANDLDQSKISASIVAFLRTWCEYLRLTEKRQGDHVFTRRFLQLAAPSDQSVWDGLRPHNAGLSLRARYGVQLEKNAFDMRTADFLWMLILSILTMLGLAFLIPVFQFAFMGPTLVFMLLYLWSREFSNSKVNISGLVTLQAFYLPWAMLLLNTMFGSPPLPDLMGIAVGHLYYFVAVLHPGSRTSSLFKPPLWVHKLVAKWNKAGPQRHSPVQPAQQSGRAFSGRSYRLNQD
ncbi:hypothetical protein O6H91_02G147900 [Diphasiastrum complanatum]|uniref:Uncharacterized protein n=1 Tax=Diphasiastrum complanatum TaxID=34168 RepID=A0ACC2ELI1_DIPCM|nr:hypothetical protein O6H91_02G147900 [Diphasiastrum complanatum]